MNKHHRTTAMKALPASLMLMVAAIAPMQSNAQDNPAANQPADAVQAGDQASLLRQSVMKGLMNSPVLDADVHALEAQVEESNVVYGSLRPTVDARGSAGRERTRIDEGEARTYNASSYGIEARQNLYNGFASHARYFAAHSGAMQSYYRYLNKANQVAFEAASGHLDVSRFQALTRLSESNLKYHQELMNRIEEKVKSGVSRQSDLEQARSRYTLALGNLTTEKANAFSAMATYQRITDTVWPVNQPGDYVIQANFEVENRERLVYALNNHPLLKAANAQINSAKLEITAASEGFHPRIDLRAKSDVYSNYLSTFDERQISSVDLLATINLYRGGSDSALRKAAIKRRLQSLDDKLNMCRLIRQSTQTALFDVVSLQKKQIYFREQAAAISKARAAYEQQFAVGRRELLDLLSAENEYYQAKRTLINVEADLSISKLKLLAATGQLTGLFGVDELVNADEPTRREVILYRDGSARGAETEGCPASLINLEDFELPSLGFDEAFRSADTPQMLTPIAALAVAPIELAQAGKSQIPAQAVASADPAEVSKRLTDKTKAWATAWQNREIGSYLAFYAGSFKPEEGNYQTWMSTRRDRLSKAGSIRIIISDIQVVPSFDKPDEYELSFVQDYQAASYQERSRKVLTWKEIKGEWLIIREQNKPLTTAQNPVKTALHLPGL